MRSLFSRTNNSPLDTSETFNVKLAEVEGAVREMVQQDADPSNPEEAPREVTAANVNVLVQRAASLSELQDIIRELQKLHDFLHSEGERLEQEISKYAELSKTTTTSTRLIANTILKSLRSSGSQPSRHDDVQQRYRGEYPFGYKIWQSSGFFAAMSLRSLVACADQAAQARAVGATGDDDAGTAWRGA